MYPGLPPPRQPGSDWCEPLDGRRALSALKPRELGDGGTVPASCAASRMPVRVLAKAETKSIFAIRRPARNSRLAIQDHAKTSHAPNHQHDHSYTSHNPTAGGIEPPWS
eukprot:scaffold6867_cov497-Prasinococcus_capsulatus_cf.AAC.1